jgi:hypothetical protein
MQPIQLSRCSSQLGFFTSVDARSTRSRIRRNLHTQKVYWREIWVGRCHRSCPATASSVRNGPGLLILTRTQEATEALAEEPNGRLRLASGRPDADTVNGSRTWHMRGSGGGGRGWAHGGFRLARAPFSHISRDRPQTAIGYQSSTIATATPGSDSRGGAGIGSAVDEPLVRVGLDTDVISFCRQLTRLLNCGCLG